jgi:hypothetical protein
MQELINNEKAAILKSNKAQLQTMPVRDYLNETVVPLLLEGLSELVMERYVFLHSRAHLLCI